MEDSKCKTSCDHSSCCKSTPNPSVCQSLDEMDFERSIWQAAIDDNVDKIENLIQKQGISVNIVDSYGISALHYAARNGNLKSAKLLLKLGADINLQTANIGATALHRAVTSNKIELVNFLINQGADKTIKDNDGLTPFDRAVKEGRNSMIDILKTSSKST